MNTLTICFLIFFISYSISAQENTTAIASIVATASINVSDDLIVNNTSNNNFNISLVRITQPSSDIKSFTNIKQEIPMKNITINKEFIPSPQLETYIEYNKYPIVPAFPESKQLYSRFSYIPPVRNQPAEDKKGYLGMTQATMNNDKNNNQQNMNKYYYMKAGYGTPQITATEKSVPSAQDKQLIPTSYEKPIRTDSDFPSLKYYERFNFGGPSASSNALYPSEPTVSSLDWYNKMLNPTKSPPTSVGDHPYPFVTDLTRHEHTLPRPMMSPWRRAAKIFAAILPIGLLISALTPNILTIGPVNTTQQCRKLAGRAELLGLDKLSAEKWSKPGCEARLLCETAVRDDNLDIEEVKQLFWTFVSQNAADSETPEELEAVSNAIKEKRCDKISCRNNKKSIRDV